MVAITFDTHKFIRKLRNLTEVDFAHFKPFSSLPKDLQTVLRGRGKQKAPTKFPVTIRYSPEVIEAFRSTGNGWQTRLKEWLKEHHGSAA